MKNTPSARVRRRRLATSASVASIVIAGVILATTLPAHSHGNPATKSDAQTPSADTTPLAKPSESLQDKVSSYIAHRDGAVGVAFYDNNSKTLTLVHPKVRGRTASIVKADILETLLHRTGGHLSDSQRETATAMIEESDNDSATDLWNQDGGAPGVAAYNTDLGLKQTTPNVDWGDTTTSAKDQVALVRELFGHSDLLTKKSQKFQKHLMLSVEADQRWGIGGAVPKSATFGNKNGWLPVDEDNDRWAVNSIGWVRGTAGQSYEIAVITQHETTEGYGIHTINRISRMAWRHATTPSTSPAG